MFIQYQQKIYAFRGCFFAGASALSSLASAVFLTSFAERFFDVRAETASAFIRLSGIFERFFRRPNAIYAMFLRRRRILKATLHQNRAHMQTKLTAILVDARNLAISARSTAFSALNSSYARH